MLFYENNVKKNLDASDIYEKIDDDKTEEIKIKDKRGQSCAKLRSSCG